MRSEILLLPAQVKPHELTRAAFFLTKPIGGRNVKVREYAEANDLPVSDVQAANAEHGGAAHPDGDVVDESKMNEHFGINKPKRRSTKKKVEEPVEAETDDAVDAEETGTIVVAQTIRPLGRKEDGKKLWEVKVLGKEPSTHVCWGHDESQAISEVFKRIPALASGTANVVATPFQQT